MQTSYKRKSLLRRRAYKPRIRFDTTKLLPGEPIMKGMKNERRQGKGEQKMGKTNVPGQNPKQNDSPSHDEHNDQSRTNQLGQEYAS